MTTQTEGTRYMILNKTVQGDSHIFEVRKKGDSQNTNKIVAKEDYDRFDIFESFSEVSYLMKDGDAPTGETSARAAARPKPTDQEIKDCKNQIVTQLKTGEMGKAALLALFTKANPDFNTRTFEMASAQLKEGKNTDGTPGQWIHAKGQGKGTLWVFGKAK